MGRNTLRSNGFDLFDANIVKHITITERAKLEYKLEIFNVLNTINFVDVPGRLVSGTSAGAFLDFTQLNSPGRSMRMGLKFVF